MGKLADEKCRSLGYDGLYDVSSPEPECFISYHNRAGGTLTFKLSLTSGLAEKMSSIMRVLRARRDAGLPMPDTLEEKQEWRREL